MERTDLIKALKGYKEAVKLKPNSSDAYLCMGSVYKNLGMPQKAIMCYQRALQVEPDYAMAFVLLGLVYYEQGNLEMSIHNYRRAITRDAEFFEAYSNLGNALRDAGRVQEATHCYDHCISFQPDHPQILSNLGNTYMERNMMSGDAQCYNSNLAVTTGISVPFTNLAVLYMQQGNYRLAISCCNEVLRINPMATDGLVNRDAHELLASAYMMSDNFEAAIRSYRQALMLHPHFARAACNLFYSLQCVCDWDKREEMFIEVEEILRRQIELSIIPSFQPFQAIAYPLNPMLALDISRKHAQYSTLLASHYSLSPFTHPPPLPIKGGGRNGRLRVGTPPPPSILSFNASFFMSNLCNAWRGTLSLYDFRNRSVSHLMGSVFGMHDSENVEVFCYAVSPNDGTEWGIRIQYEAEHFIDVSSLTFDLTARMINEDRIQILIDLNGYTKGGRSEIFAMQPAPIQVSYMGFPGTTGATYIDYMITDEFVSPMNYAHYSEKLVHLPHCYFVSDYKQKNRNVLYPNSQPKRSDYGLPEDKFIFACFNQLNKMDPEIFTTWCNILKRVPKSVLWLLRFPAAGEKRLRACKRIPVYWFMPLCNAHTTGTDVLWAGLPMITLPLEKMATRVAGSLCLATGLGDEMIVSSMKEYEKVVFLALNRPKLKDLTNRLKAVRMSCPLFDTARWVRNLERSYFKMWNLYCSGQHPQHFKVIENDAEFPFDR
ncbi:hypothetical protein KY284_037874 [Solanum tuberosum]|nr:hypothetical protein KY284_037874 [Solanum tuberosum]